MGIDTLEVPLGDSELHFKRDEVIKELIIPKEFNTVWYLDDGKVLLTWNITDSESKVIQDLSYLNKLYLGSCYNTRDKEDLKYYLKFFKEYILNYFDNDLELNIDQFIGRCLSRSYSPSENDDIYDEYIDGLNSIFYDNSKEGKIIIKNKTRSMIGMVK